MSVQGEGVQDDDREDVQRQWGKEPTMGLRGKFPDLPGKSLQRDGGDHFVSESSR